MSNSINIDHNDIDNDNSIVSNDTSVYTVLNNTYLLSYILSYLDYNNVTTIKPVNKQWHRIYKQLTICYNCANNSNNDNGINKQLQTIHIDWPHHCVD